MGRDDDMLRVYSKAMMLQKQQLLINTDVRRKQ